MYVGDSKVIDYRLIYFQMKSRIQACSFKLILLQAEVEVVNSSQNIEMSEERMIMSLGKTAYDGILTLTNQQRAIEKAAFRKNNSGTGRGPGRPPTSDIPIEELLPVEDEVFLCRM